MPYSHFTLEERDALQLLLSSNVGKAEIARALDKDPSSIHREILLNSVFGCYIGHLAHRMASARRRLSKPCPKRSNQELMASVERLLKEDLSPEQISGRISLERPQEKSWHISHETIYQHVYGQALAGADLRPHLRQGRKKRAKRASGKSRRGQIPNRVFIDERPPIVETKGRRGDWEGDIVEGKGRQGYIATFVDRKSKYLVAYRLPNKTAARFTSGAIRAFTKVPGRLIKTITLDSGKENSYHAELASGLSAKVYFAHPYHAWERGLNEHTNGLMRQYFPKSKPLTFVHHRTLDKVVSMLNNRPRKSLGYRTPREVLFNLPIALQT